MFSKFLSLLAVVGLCTVSLAQEEAAEEIQEPTAEELAQQKLNQAYFNYSTKYAQTYFAYLKYKKEAQKSVAQLIDEIAKLEVDFAKFEQDFAPLDSDMREYDSQIANLPLLIKAEEDFVAANEVKIAGEQGVLLTNGFFMAGEAFDATTFAAKIQARREQVAAHQATIDSVDAKVKEIMATIDYQTIYNNYTTTKNDKAKEESNRDAFIKLLAGQQEQLAETIARISVLNTQLAKEKERRDLLNTALIPAEESRRDSAETVLGSYKDQVDSVSDSLDILYGDRSEVRGDLSRAEANEAESRRQLTTYENELKGLDALWSSLDAKERTQDQLAANIRIAESNLDLRETQLESANTAVAATRSDIADYDRQIQRQQSERGTVSARRGVEQGAVDRTQAQIDQKQITIDAANGSKKELARIERRGLPEAKQKFEAASAAAEAANDTAVELQGAITAAESLKVAADGEIASNKTKYDVEVGALEDLKAQLAAAEAQGTGNEDQLRAELAVAEAAIPALQTAVDTAASEGEAAIVPLRDAFNAKREAVQTLKGQTAAEACPNRKKPKRQEKCRTRKITTAKAERLVAKGAFEAAKAAKAALIAAAESELQAGRTKVEGIQQSLAQPQRDEAKIAQLQSAIRSKESDVTAAKATWDGAISLAATRQGEVKEAKKALKQHNRSNKGLSDRVARTSERVGSLTKRIAELNALIESRRQAKGEKRALVSQIETQRRVVANTDTEIANIDATISEIGVTRSQAEGRLHGEEAEANEALLARNQAQTQLDTLDRDQATVIDEIADIVATSARRTDLRNLLIPTQKRDLEGQEDGVDSLTNRLSSLNSTIGTQENSLGELRVKKADAQGVYTDHLKQLTTFQEELGRLISSIGDDEAELIVKTSMQGKFEIDIPQTETNLASSKVLVAEYTAAFARAETEWNSYYKKFLEPLATQKSGETSSRRREEAAIADIQKSERELNTWADEILRSNGEKDRLQIALDFNVKKKTDLTPIHTAAQELVQNTAETISIKALAKDDQIAEWPRKAQSFVEFSEQQDGVLFEVVSGMPEEGTVEELVEEIAVAGDESVANFDSQPAQ